MACGERALDGSFATIRFSSCLRIEATYSRSVPSAQQKTGDYRMALYKYSQFLTQSTDSAFDATHSPGVAAPHAGIYRCNACGYEIGIAEGHTLPPQSHHKHSGS